MNSVKECTRNLPSIVNTLLVCFASPCIEKGSSRQPQRQTPPMKCERKNCIHILHCIRNWIVRFKKSILPDHWELRHRKRCAPRQSQQRSSQSVPENKRNWAPLFYPFINFLLTLYSDFLIAILSATLARDLTWWNIDVPLLQIAMYQFRVNHTMWQLIWVKPVYENQSFQGWRGQVYQRTFLLSTWEGQYHIVPLYWKWFSAQIALGWNIFIATFPSVSLLLLHKHTTHTLETVEPPKNTC